MVCDFPHVREFYANLTPGALQKLVSTESDRIFQACLDALLADPEWTSDDKPQYAFAISVLTMLASRSEPPVVMGKTTSALLDAVGGGICEGLKHMKEERI